MAEDQYEMPSIVTIHDGHTRWSLDPYYPGLLITGHGATGGYGYWAARATTLGTNLLRPGHMTPAAHAGSGWYYLRWVDEKQ